MAVAAEESGVGTTAAPQGMTAIRTVLVAAALVAVALSMGGGRSITSGIGTTCI